MNEDEIMEKLSYDISEIELPPISEKVLQAVREKSESCCKTIENNVENIKVRRITTVKCVFAAIIAFLVLSIPIIVVLSNNNSNLVITEESEISDNSNYDVSRSDTPNETNNPSVLEKIKLKEVYGKVALTKRPEKECEMYLINYDPENSVYEDDNYLYNFDSDGNLVEIINISDNSENLTTVDKITVMPTAESLFTYYFPELKKNEYSITVDEYKNSMFTYIVNLTKKNKNVIESNIRITFDDSGRLCRLILNNAATNVGNISKKQAVEIALDELKKGEYNLPSFDLNNIEIQIELQKEKSCYSICIFKIPSYGKDFYAYAFIDIDINSSKIIYSEIVY